MPAKDKFNASPCIKQNQTKLPENPDLASFASVKKGHFPKWLHRKMPKGKALSETEQILKKYELNTVCAEAKCPNLLECYSHKTATFLTMGKSCTRACGFCDILTSNKPPPLDENEPMKIAQAVKELGLKHIVLTMVARDDLEDGGAQHLSDILTLLKKQAPDTTLEVLTSDFAGNKNAWDTIIHANPHVFNHNIETVERLSPYIRHKATYSRSLEMLTYFAKHAAHIQIKSGLMLGLGESQEEVHQSLKDLKQAGCRIVTMGQYLQANPKKLRVKKFVLPEEFEAYAKHGRELGIQNMFCGPFVRSSYHAFDQVTVGAS